MENPRWRREAKDVLYTYGANVQRLREIERDVLYRGRVRRDNRYGKGGLVDNTAMKALELLNEDTEYLRRAVRAVELLVRALTTNRRVDRDRLHLLELVYFQARTGVYGAAVLLDVSERTAKRWNDWALRFVGRQMGLLPPETE